METNRLYEFGDFLFDTKEKVLTRAEGSPVALTPKVFEMLLLFIENPNRLIEKEELMSKIWADSFVEDSNLTFNIRQLRKALGDDAQNPAFIKTVPRRGYRFIAEVKSVEEKDLRVEFADIVIRDAPPPAENFLDHIELSVAPKPLRAALPLLVILGLTIVALAGTSWVWHNFPPKAGLASPILEGKFKSQKLTNTGGVYQAVISPDGKRMAYSSEVNTKQGIWIRQLDTAENTQIVPNGDDFYYGLSFTRDGETLYFARGRDTEKISIYRVSVLGGIPKEIAADTEGWFSLSPDDRRISYVRRNRANDDEYSALFVADADGRNERRIATRPRPVQIADNQFSPDGKSIAFAAGHSKTASSEFSLMEIDVADGTERKITSKSFFSVRHLRWLPDQNGLVITANEQFELPTQIYQVARASGEVRLLPKDPNNYNQISFDDRAEKMVVTHFTPDFRLWLAPRDNLSAVELITFAQGGFDYAASGKMVYGSMTDGSLNIWMMNGSGDEQRQLTSGQGANWQPRVSPDERFIYFASNRSGTAQVWRMNADGTNQTQLSTGEGGEPLAVAPDGKTVYYMNSLDSKLRKISIDGDAVFASSLVSNEKMFEPAINPAGDRAAYFSRREDDSFEIFLSSTSDGSRLKSFKLADGKDHPAKIVWATDGKSLYYLTRSGSKSAIRQLYLESEKTALLTEMNDHEVTDFAFSPNGGTFAFICGRWKHDAYLIEGLKQ